MENAVRASYDAVAGEYARRIADELEGKPFDRTLLERFAARTQAAGPVWDVGCGPGHVAAFLRERGVDVSGVDLSPGMLAAGRARFPHLPVVCADMRRLPAPSASLGGMVALYSLIHIPAGQLKDVLREFVRVLKPGAPLLVGFHMGTQVVHLDRWWETPVDVDFHFFEARLVNDRLLAAGFMLEEHHEREPYAEVEHASRRAYVVASRPG